MERYPLWNFRRILSLVAPLQEIVARAGPAVFFVKRTADAYQELFRGLGVS